MGRTVPTYGQSVKAEIQALSKFRLALLRGEDREAFDRVCEYVLLHRQASSLATRVAGKGRRKGGKQDIQREYSILSVYEGGCVMADVEERAYIFFSFLIVAFFFGGLLLMLYSIYLQWEAGEPIYNVLFRFGSVVTAFMGLMIFLFRESFREWF